MLVENLTWGSRGVSNRVALVPYARGMSGLSSSGVFEYACYTDKSTGDVHFMARDVSTGLIKKLIWKCDYYTVIEVSDSSNARYKLQVCSMRDVLMNAEKLGWDGIYLK